MSKLLYNGVELPAVPAHDADATVEVISAVLPAALSMYAQSPYILVIGKGTLWQGGKCYVRGVSAVYRLSGDAWMWHYGSGTVSAQDIVAANYFEAIWTNTDIPTADGAGIYLAASAPVDPDAPDEPEPEEPPVEPNVDVAAIYRRGWMDGFLSGINIRGILRRRKVEEPQPVTAYLYGTPSPTIVTYNGVELPELPEWDKSVYPYAYINISSSGAQQLILLPRAAEYSTYSTGNTTYTAANVKVEGGETLNYLLSAVSNGAWGELTSKSLNNTSIVPARLRFNEVIWCNTDIPNIDNNTVYLAASEPVRTNSGNVALAEGEGYVLYNGAVLPPLPEWDKVKYPCAVLGKYALGGGKYRTMLCYSSLPLHESILGLMPPEGCIGLSYMYYEDKWQLSENWDDGNPFGMPSNSPTWANYDVMASDGTTVSVAASEPIPLASSEPVAAAHEGMRWDVKTYPYACFGTNAWGNTLFMYSKTPCERTDNWWVMAGVAYFLVNGVWEYQFDTSNSTGNARTVIVPQWSNHDLYEKDGSLFLKGTEPVLIYEKKE